MVLADSTVTGLLITGIALTFIVAVVDGRLNWIVQANLSGPVPRATAGVLCIVLLAAFLHAKGILWAPPDFATALGEAQISLDKGRLDKALQEYTDAVNTAQQPSEKGDAYRGMAETYKKKGDKDQALDYYKMAAAAQDQPGDCSRCGEENKDLESATELSSRLPDPELANAWMRLAKHDEVAGRLDEGEIAWEQVVDLTADPLTSWAEFEEAQRHYNPQEAHIAHSVVTCLHQNQPPPHADPGWVDYEAYHQTKVIEESGNLPGALCGYEKTRGILAGEPLPRPDWVHFYYKDFGRALVQARYYTLALKQLERAEQLHKDDVWVLGGMADAYRGLGRDEQACSYYKKAASTATFQDDPSGDLKRAATLASCTM
jgi:tetratricopeptide (TPR) repeat protein